MLRYLSPSISSAKYTSSATVPTPCMDDLSLYHGKVSPVHTAKDPDPFSLVAASIFRSVSTFLAELEQMPRMRTYLSHHTGDAIFCLGESLLQADGPRASVAHICLDESGTSVASAIPMELFRDWEPAPLTLDRRPRPPTPGAQNGSFGRSNVAGPCWFHMPWQGTGAGPCRRYCPKDFRSPRTWLPRSSAGVGAWPGRGTVVLIHSPRHVP